MFDLYIVDTECWFRLSVLFQQGLSLYLQDKTWVRIDHVSFQAHALVSDCVIICEDRDNVF